jgi:2,3-bisphosphoglycerate-independent phosphoglycerate mutase
MRPARVLFLFIDGIGIAAPDPAVNPWAAARLPCLDSLLGTAPVSVEPEQPLRETSAAVLIAADACLGVAGRPQSGTGQTALLTGANAPHLFGRHFGPWVPTPLRPLLLEENLLSRAVGRGQRAIFANAVPGDHGGGARIPRRPIAPPLAAVGAGVRLRGVEELLRGEAVASSFSNHRWQAHHPAAAELPALDPRGAGRRLAELSLQAELTLFAHYDTDLVGHRGGMPEAIRAVEALDAFLGGVLEELATDTLVVLASDHGNLEDVREGHTRNPVPVLAVGPGRRELAREVRSITDLAPVLDRLLEEGAERPADGGRSGPSPT